MLGPLGLEQIPLQVSISCHVGSGKQTWIFWKKPNSFCLMTYLILSYVFVYHMGICIYTEVPLEVTGHIPRSWSNRQWGAIQHGCWKLSSGSVRDQYSVLTP